MNTGAGRYTSRPVTIEAFRWGGQPLSDAPDWFKEAEGRGDVEVLPSSGVDVVTNEGVMRCNIGDWIIKGTEGELYPCKDSVFQRKYEPAAE